MEVNRGRSSRNKSSSGRDGREGRQLRRGDHDCCGGRGRRRRHILLLLLLDGGNGGGEGSDKIKLSVAIKRKVVTHGLEKLAEVMTSVPAEDGRAVVNVREVCQTAAQTQVLREGRESRVFMCCPVICLLLVMMMREVVLLRGGGVVVVLVVSLLLRDN